MAYTSMRKAGDKIEKFLPFEGNSMRAEYCKYSPDAGQLGGEWRKVLREVFAIMDDQPVYVVFSYATPIAWALFPSGGNATQEPLLIDIVSQKFSATTGQHQSVLRHALGNHKAVRPS